MLVQRERVIGRSVSGANVSGIVLQKDNGNNSGSRIDYIGRGTIAGRTGVMTKMGEGSQK